MGVTLSKEDDMLDQFYGLGLRELSMNGDFSSLPEEIILHIFSFCDVRSVLEASTLSRRLRKVASDETIWKAIFKAKWGVCRSREEGGALMTDRYDWREEFMHRQRYLVEKRRERQRPVNNVGSSSPSNNATSLASQIWDTVVSNLNPFTPVRKRKVVFVGPEAAGKVPLPLQLFLVLSSDRYRAVAWWLLLYASLTTHAALPDYMLLQVANERGRPQLLPHPPPYVLSLSLSLCLCRSTLAP
jgi:hypothetical protein